MEHTPRSKSLSFGLAITLVLVGLPLTVAGSASAQSVSQEYCPDWSGNILNPCIEAEIEFHDEPLVTEVIIPVHDSDHEMCIAADICINVPELSLEPERVADNFLVYAKVGLGDDWWDRACEHDNIPCLPWPLDLIPDIPPEDPGDVKIDEAFLADSNGDGAFDGVLFETDAGNYYIPLNS